MEFTLLAAALTGVAALWLVLRLTGGASATEVAVTAVVADMVVGRLVAMGRAGVNPVTNPVDIPLVRGGVDTVGATVGAVAYLLWSARRDATLLGRIAPAATAGLAGWHAGCVWRGSCLGTAGDVPWGWTLPGSDLTRHPTELYTALLLLASTVVLVRWKGRGGAGLTLAAAAAARLLTEPLRPHLGGSPAWWYAAGVGTGLAWTVIDRRRSSPASAGHPPPSGRK